ncbi:MAG TPA: HAMP domain-containing sensor histidine kinase [Bacillota bacterium]|nr:HAMP domain-containing sensor histidine kinase [Bacillota bacterium]
MTDIQIVVLILLCVISGLLIFSQVKGKYNYWYSGFIFSESLGVLSAIILENVTPHTGNFEFFKLIARLISALSYRFCPYFLLLLGLSVSRFFNEKTTHRLYFLLLLPIVISFSFDFIFPKTGFLTVLPDYSPNFWITVTWSTVYMLAGNIILLYSYFTEQHPRLKHEKLLVAIITGPSLYSLILCYIVPLFFGMHLSIKYDLIPTILVFVTFMYFAFHFGILGLKITLENQRLDSTVKAVSSGTSLLHHTLKHEFAKIKLCLHNLSVQYQIERDDNIQIINGSTEHILQMMNRIHEKTREISLVLDSNDIRQVIEEALLQSKPLLESKNIIVHNNCKMKAIILSDETHLREVICNLINNSIDALPEGGEIWVDLYQTKKEFVVEIKDNGTGINKENLPYLFEPFFTTKNHQSNYGLGLTYCYNVMKEHQGSIEIISHEGKGASVLLKFPASKTMIIITPAVNDGIKDSVFN